MTRDYVLWHLKEASNALSRVVREMDADPEYSEAELLVEMTHLYHHLNTAWNARDVSDERIAACSASDFRAWRQFPADVDMTLGIE